MIMYGSRSFERSCWQRRLPRGDGRAQGDGCEQRAPEPGRHSHTDSGWGFWAEQSWWSEGAVRRERQAGSALKEEGSPGQLGSLAGLGNSLLGVVLMGWTRGGSRMGERCRAGALPVLFRVTVQVLRVSTAFRMSPWCSQRLQFPRVGDKAAPYHRARVL